ADDVAVVDAACRRVVGMDANGFASGNLRRLTVCARVELTVQPRRRLIGDEMQRELLGPRTAEPLFGLEPDGMAGTVVVTEAGDRFRVELDAAARGRQLATVGVGAEPVEERVVVGALRQARFAGFPELVERRHLDVAFRDSL